MNKFTTLLSIVVCMLVCQGLRAQAFSDDFENYPVNDYLALNSGGNWTTWSGSPGSSEDAMIVDTRAYSGTQSGYWESPFGNGPQDVVLPFGGRHTSGRFKFTAKFYVPSGKSGYFNFQAGATTGVTWAFELYMRDNGDLEVFGGGSFFASYPQDQWFEMKVDINLDDNKWDFYIDNALVGTFANTFNAVSYIDIFSADPNTEFWMDDVTYCINSYCDPDLSFDALSINPDPLCTNHYAEVELSLKNNGPVAADAFTLGLDMPGQGLITRVISLDKLPVGEDTVLKINDLFKTQIAGSNQDVKAYNVTTDFNASNDTIGTLINVIPSPYGSEAIKSTPFEGVFKNGDFAMPDLIQVGQTNTYEMTPPSGYTNANFGTSWDISNVTVLTRGGAVVPAANYTITAPAGSANAQLTYKGTTAYLDSTIVISVSIVNIPGGCDSTVTRVIGVVPTPHPNFKYSSPVCFGDNVVFDNTSSIHSGNMTYKWDFGTPGADTSDIISPVFKFPAAGSYNVKLTAVSSPWGIVKDTTITVVVNPAPVVKFKVVNNCEGIAVAFQNQTTVAGNGAITYDWDFGDASAHSTQVNPSRLYAAPGGYRVTLKATSGGCSAEFSRNAYTFHRPDPAFVAPPASVCENAQTVFTNNSTIGSGEYGSVWDFGDGSKEISRNGVHSYTSAGTYNVKLLTISEFDCRDSVIKPVTVKAGPQAAFTANHYCSRTPTIFTNTTTEELANPVYTWTFSDGSSSALKNVTRSWPNEGDYSVTLKVTYSNGCSNEISKNFRVLTQPKADFMVNDICAGEPSVFVNLSTGTRDTIHYLWDLATRTTTEWSPEEVYPNQPTTTYNVKLVAYYKDGCADTMAQVITVSEAPKCNFTITHKGFSRYVFTPDVTNYPKYSWIFGDGAAASIATPEHQYTSGGTFHVTLKAQNAAGCNCSLTLPVDGITGINDISSEDRISVYPNPSNGVFTVSSEDKGALKVEVYTLTGDKLYSSTHADGIAQVQLSGQPSGIYLLKVISGNVTTTRKINIIN